MRSARPHCATWNHGSRFQCGRGAGHRVVAVGADGSGKRSPCLLRRIASCWACWTPPANCSTRGATPRPCDCWPRSWKRRMTTSSWPATQADGPNAGRQYRSLKKEARSVLSGMPPAAQEAYELQFGAVARQLLDEPWRKAISSKHSEVQQRYFGTAAGYEATYLLGYYALNQGRFLTAMRHFQRLQVQQSGARYEPELSLKLAICWQWLGEPAQAKEVLVELQKRFPQARFAVGGRSVELFRRSDDALQWLRNIAGEPPAENRSLSVHVDHVSPRSGSSGSRQRQARPVHATGLATGGLRPFRTGVGTAGSAG